MKIEKLDVKLVKEKSADYSYLTVDNEKRNEYLEYDKNLKWKENF